MTTKKPTAKKAVTKKPTIKKFSQKNESFLGAEISEDFYNTEITAKEKNLVKKMNKQRENLNKKK
jgi:hypothetical protein